MGLSGSFQHSGVDDNNAMPIEPSHSGAVAWPDGSVAQNLTDFSGCEVQITAVTGTIAFTRSFDGVATYLPVKATDPANGYAKVDPAAPGFFTLPGGAFLKWSGTGTLLIRGFN